MDILFLLVPMSVLLALAILGVFAWALQAGQFDAVDDEGRRILDEPLPPATPALDADQGPPTPALEQSARPVSTDLR